MSARSTVSACIIARNEAERLPACLASVAFCDEILVIDSGSTDGTPELAEAAGARVVHEPWKGFGGQRNVAIDHARGDWVLEVDADERISPRLREEIELFLAAPPAGVELAGLPLRDHFLGHPLGPSAKYPKYRHRLLRRGAYRHREDRTVHEGLVPVGPVHPFEGDLDHLLATSWREAVGDAWTYARLEAGQMTAPVTASGAVKGALLRPAAKLVYRTVVDGGWRDGWPGLAKILLDVGTDSVVWIRHASGRTTERGDSGVAPDEHFGAWKYRLGSPRVVALALGAPATETAARWLASAPAAADVTLVTDAPAAACAARVRRLPTGGPLSVVRGLDAEEQLRPADAVVPFGRRATRILSRVPEAGHGEVGEVHPEREPLAALLARIELTRGTAA